MSHILNSLRTVLTQDKNVRIMDFVINKGCTEEEIHHIQSAIKMQLPTELKQFYSEMNGCKIEWTLKSPEGSLYAYLNVTDINTAFYGYGERENRSTDDAFKDVIWNDSFERELMEELKLHHLFESFEGRSENTTFKITNGTIQLFDVYEDVITPINLSFKEYVEGVIRWGGIETIRDEIIKQQGIPDESFNDKAELFKSNFKQFYETISVQKK